MSLASELRDYLIAEGVMTDERSFVSHIPAANLSLDDAWAIVAQGGSVSGGNILQWKRSHTLTILYRNNDGSQLYDKDDLLVDALNKCVLLQNYQVISKSLNPMTELQLSANETHVASWQLQITTIKKG